MELGYLLYFLIVFVCGGILLLGSGIYLAWELITYYQRPPWSIRTQRARVMLVSSGLLFASLALIPLRMLWVTRVDAIAGSYTSEGVWGTATLIVQRDGHFVETWRFKNELNGKPEGDGVTRGTWRDDGRDWLTRNIELTSFKGLASYQRESAPAIVIANVMGYGGTTTIEIDVGADIAFRK